MKRPRSPKGQVKTNAESKEDETVHEEITEQPTEENGDEISPVLLNSKADNSEAEELDSHSDEGSGEDSEDDHVDFSQLRGIGEGTDESDPEDALEVLAVSKLPGKKLSEYKNDGPAVDKRLADIALFDTAKPYDKGLLPFRESLSVTMSMDEPLDAKLAIDDLARERKFAELATAAVHDGLSRLRSEKIKFRRPDDYFAQMVKTDAQMAKVKTRMLAQKERIQAAEKRRNNRDIVKNKKKVRQEQRLAQQEKKKQTKDEIAAVSKLRKERLKKRGEGTGDDSDDDFPIELLNVEQLDSDNRFQPAADIAAGKKKAWSQKIERGSGQARSMSSRDQKGMREKGARYGRLGEPARDGKNRTAGGRGPASGAVKKPRGSKKRLGKSRRKVTKRQKE